MKISQKGWVPLALVILLTVAALIISVISLVFGWLTIFQNLFYFPIILACIFYLKRGFVFVYPGGLLFYPDSNVLQ